MELGWRGQMGWEGGEWVSLSPAQRGYLQSAILGLVSLIRGRLRGRGLLVLFFLFFLLSRMEGALVVGRVA